MSSPVTVQLQRMSTMQPWGFRLQGGQDFRQELSIKKVDFKSKLHFCKLQSLLHGNTKGSCQKNIQSAEKMG